MYRQAREVPARKTICIQVKAQRGKLLFSQESLLYIVHCQVWTLSSYSFIACPVFAWNPGFRYKVLSAPGGGDYSGKTQAALATRRRRHLSMDESGEGIIRFLEAMPQLQVQDFHEHNLGLLRFSFNLNPAMMASVSSWTRSNW